MGARGTWEATKAANPRCMAPVHRRQEGHSVSRRRFSACPCCCCRFWLSFLPVASWLTCSSFKGFGCSITCEGRRKRSLIRLGLFFPRSGRSVAAVQDCPGQRLKSPSPPSIKVMLGRILAASLIRAPVTNACSPSLAPRHSLSFAVFETARDEEETLCACVSHHVNLAHTHEMAGTDERDGLSSREASPRVVPPSLFAFHPVP